MIDDRQQELAALYAFDLLEGAELAQFEAALATDPELQLLVRELRDASSSFAQASATPPPPALKQRILGSLSAKPRSGAPDNVIRPPASVFTNPRLSWAVAACFAVLAAWLAQRFYATQNEVAQLRRQNAVADVALQSVRQQLEADRIVSGRQLQELDQKLNAAQTQLTQARSEVDRTSARLAEVTRQGTAQASSLAAAESQLAAARRDLAAREADVASLTRRVDAVAGASAELGKQLEQARERMAQLTTDMLRERELADLKISVLASLARDNPQALAVAVWDVTKKEGVLKVEKLPALAANQDYQLWIVDPQYKDPVDGGVFTVDPATGQSRLSFKAKQPITAVNAFAISLERKGGVPKAEGPILLLGK